MSEVCFKNHFYDEEKNAKSSTKTKKVRNHDME